MQTLLTISAIMHLIVISLCEENETTSSTATVNNESISAKPTTIIKSVEQVPKEKPDTSLNLFQLRDPEIRRRSKIWNWDYWCQMQPKKGNCTNFVERYYYDASLDMCMKFTYSGCNGNKNRFDNIVECEQHCVGAVFMTIKKTDPAAFCLLQQSSGLCFALIPQFYYDLNGNTCKPFTYGGCGGNQNRFTSISHCYDVCKNREPDSDYDDSGY